MIALAPTPPLPDLSDEEAHLLHAFLCSGGSIPQLLQATKLHIADFLEWSTRPAVRAHLALYEELLQTFARLSALAQLPCAHQALGRVAASDNLAEARRAAMALLTQRRGPTTRRRTTPKPPASDPDAPNRPTGRAPRPKSGRASTNGAATGPAPHADDHLHHNGTVHPEPTGGTRATETPTDANPGAAHPTSPAAIEPDEPAATDLPLDGRPPPPDTSNDAAPTTPPHRGETRARDRPS